MHAFPPKAVVAVRSERVVCTVKIGDLRVKAFQIGFQEDGTLFAHFPYFRHRTGILSSSEIPATGQRKADVNIEHGGKVTSHRVKYSHHPDGQAHFSQDKKIITAIRRQSVSLDKQNGHIFSLHIQGMHALDAASAIKDGPTISSTRSVIDFLIPPTAEAIKFVGRWLDESKLTVSEPHATVGPRLTMLAPNGNLIDAILLASPFSHSTHMFAVNCTPIGRLGPEPEIFQFVGAFDPQEIMTDPAKKAGFLAFLYPVPDADTLRKRLGSVDYVAPSQKR
jgi:hypothetical protein